MKEDHQLVKIGGLVLDGVYFGFVLGPDLIEIYVVEFFLLLIAQLIEKLSLGLQLIDGLFVEFDLMLVLLDVFFKLEDYFGGCSVAFMLLGVLLGT